MYFVLSICLLQFIIIVTLWLLFCNMMHSHFYPKAFLNFLLITSLSPGLLCNMLFNPPLYVWIFQFSYNWPHTIAVWEVFHVFFFPVFFSILVIILWTNMWSLLESILCVLEDVYSVSFRWNILSMFIKFTLSGMCLERKIVHFFWIVKFVGIYNCS